MQKEQLFFEDIVEGMELPSQEENNMSMTTIVKFAGASGDFSPIHHDMEVARNQGLDKPIVMGPLKMALLDRFIGDWLEPGGVLRKLSVRFRGLDYAGDSLVIEGRVNRKYNMHDNNYVECELWIENKERGEKTTFAKAIMCLPSKGRDETNK
ncbi:MaoC/PaaZ C-terminal domain-containing protein [Chloroflexota bacterium]